jgi:ABC-type uncharacterized transport system permease subunit
MSWDLAASTLRVSTPLIFAALGGMFSERSGVINIALEGLMLMGAFAAAVGTLVTHSPWLGSALGMAAGVMLAAVYALAVIRLRADQIVAGVAINMLAMGLTPFLCKILYDVTGSTPGIPLSDRFRIRAAVPVLGAGGGVCVVDAIHADRFVGEFRRGTSRGARCGGYPGQSRAVDRGAGQRRAGGNGRAHRCRFFFRRRSRAT